MPIIHEQLERSRGDIDAYEKWIAKERHRQILDFMAEHLYKVPLEDALLIEIEARATNGFVFHHPGEPISDEDLVYMHTYLKDRILRLEKNYALYLSDSKTYDRSQYVERIDRYYLKPQTNHDQLAGKILQQYGNIHIELIWVNDRVSMLKFYRHHHTDRKYEKALEFGELMEFILRS